MCKALNICSWMHVYMRICLDIFKNCGCVYVCVLYWSRKNVHWKQSGGGEGNMTARLACSAGDPTHHLPPGSPFLKNNRIFYSASPSSGLWIGSCTKNASLIKYPYVRDLAHTARIKALSARFSTIQGFETFRFVEALYLCVGVYIVGDLFCIIFTL